MLLLPLALSACAQAGTTQPATVTETDPTTVFSTFTKAAPTVTETETEEAVAQPANAAPSPFGTAGVRVGMQGNPELVIQDVRAGTHDGFDRVVFEYAGPGLPGYIAGYNPEPRQQASGFPLEVPGNAFLELMIQGTPMMMMSPREDLIGTGQVRVAPGGGYVGAGSVQSVVHGGVFEADTQYVIGLDRERPFQVYLLENPTRVVVEFQQ